MPSPPCDGRDFVARDIPQYTDDSGVPAYYIRLAMPVKWLHVNNPCWYCLGCEQAETYSPLAARDAGGGE